MQSGRPVPSHPACRRIAARRHTHPIARTPYRDSRSRVRVEQRSPLARLLLPLILSLVALPCVPVAVAQARTDAFAKLPGQPAGAPKFNQSAGYIMVEGRKAYFYWLMEAIGQPESKPLLLWLNGGPGCSSVGCGLFEEVGPWRVASKAATALVYNRFAWNRLVNVVFLESPVGVGYSYSNDTSDYTTDDAQTAKDNHAFLVGFLARHPRYAGREFYIAGRATRATTFRSSPPE
ncbi:hypothetical protein CLOP_g14491 [Closterium sp. NIES-67]|nr:hypothetical protein CLOP_g14491 [Closterium sp. NIES-67]